VSQRQLILTVGLIAVVGISLGVFGGALLKNRPVTTPAPLPNPSAASNNTYTGRIFEIDQSDGPANGGYTHKLLDASGKVTAYLSAIDDKLKVVLPTTVVTIQGVLLKKIGDIPVVRVDSLSF